MLIQNNAYDCWDSKTTSLIDKINFLLILIYYFKKPTFIEIWPNIKHFIYEVILAIHNAIFDISFLNIESSVLAIFS